MTRQDALTVVEELEKLYLNAPHPGGNPASIKLFEQKARDLEWSVQFQLETSQMVESARTFYSPRKWQKYPSAGTLLLQSIARVKMRIKMAPDSSFQ